MSTSTLDFYQLDTLLSDGQRALRDQVRAYVEDVILPHINPYWERAEFPREMVLGLNRLPIMGGMLSGYSCAGLDPLEAGLVRYELARGDGSIGTFYGVHSGLAMGSIGLLGSEAQRERWLPGMARLELIGAFRLTEPLRGFDAAHVLTTAVRDLVEMAAEVTQMQLMCFRLAQLMAAGQMDESVVAMAKYNNTAKARRVAQLAREALGGNGILIENHVARHFTDAEALYTYEGTHEINMLIVGRALTDISAFT